MHYSFSLSMYFVTSFIKSKVKSNFFLFNTLLQEEMQVWDKE